MKKINILIAGLCSVAAMAQFNISIEAEQSFTPKEIYLYTTEGSKQILEKKVDKKNNKWSYQFPKNYSGMMKAYLPELNYTLNFISENKDVKIKLSGTDKVAEVHYIDPANQLMNALQDKNGKQKNILPVLLQLTSYYAPTTDFRKALEKEVEFLSNPSTQDFSNYPFISYYNNTYQQFLLDNPTKPKPTNAEITQFIVNSNELLETSSLIRPLLLQYLRNVNNSNAEQEIDQLLAKTNVETPRGQTILSELIEIFDVYSMNSLKEKYLTHAQNLKCTINERLASTIETNNKTAVGAKLENYKFQNATNTTAKSLYDVKANKKVIVFWASTCSHCEKELPQFIPYYSKMKEQEIEIIGFSLDTNKATFTEKASLYPWINDTELKGWYSTVTEMYNIHATPTYFILDKDNKILEKPNQLNDVLNYLGLK